MVEPLTLFFGAAQPVPSDVDLTGYLRKKERGRTPSSIPTASDHRRILVSLVTVDTTVNLFGSSAGCFWRPLML